MESNPIHDFGKSPHTIDVRKGGHSVRRAIEVLGSKVVNVESGKVVGIVEDILFDRQGQLQGFILERKSWFQKSLFLPIAEVKTIGEDMLTTQQDLHQRIDQVAKDWVRLAEGHSQIKGSPVISSTGKQLGTLEDVYFHEELGTIIGYELSDGFFSDLMEGRRVIQTPDRIFIGDDALIIHSAEEKERTL